MVSATTQAVLDLVRAELGRPAEGERQLAHIFTLLSLALEPEPLRIAWAALRGRDRALRGTALEYLDTVLPDDIFLPLRKRCGEETAPEGPRRPVEQVAAEVAVVEPVAAEVAEPVTAEAAVAEPVAAEATVAEPVTAEATVAELATAAVMV